jgi:hypothetical protein
MEAGRRGLDDAVSILRAAYREGDAETRGVGLLSLALALDRRGDEEEARRLLSSRPLGDPRDQLTTPKARELFVLAPSEASAACALALQQGGDRDGAEEFWEEAAAQSAADSPWRAYADAHITHHTARMSAGGPNTRKTP